MGKMTVMVQMRWQLPRCHRARQLDTSKNDDGEEEIREKRRKSLNRIFMICQGSDAWWQDCRQVRVSGYTVDGLACMEKKSRAEVVMTRRSD